MNKHIFLNGYFLLKAFSQTMNFALSTERSKFITSSIPLTQLIDVIVATQPCWNCFRSILSGSFFKLHAWVGMVEMVVQSSSR